MINPNLLRVNRISKLKALLYSTTQLLAKSLICDSQVLLVHSGEFTVLLNLLLSGCSRLNVLFENVSSLFQCS